MRVDIHTNLDWFPTSKSSQTIINATVSQMANYLLANKIDVNVCLYPRDGYHILEELARVAPNVKHIGLQTLMGVDANDPTNPNELILDVNDPERSAINGIGLSYGIKVASHRGWWKRADKVTSGFCYGKGDRDLLNKWLRSMPKNSICSLHTQGDPIDNSASIPTTIGKYAYKYKHVKFILNHCGDFGQGGFSNKPKKYITINKQGEVDLFPAYRYAHSMGLIDTAVHMANTLHNVLLDTSVYTPYKGIAMGRCKRWAIGSDYPFQVKEEHKHNSTLMLKEEKKFIKDLGEDRVSQCHNDAYYWLTTNVDQLMKENEWYEV